MGLRAFIQRASGMLDVMADDYVAVFAASAHGEIPLMNCKTQQLDPLGLVRVAIFQFNANRDQRSFWSAIDLPAHPLKTVRVYAESLDHEWIMGVVAAGEGPPIGDETVDFGDLDVAHAFFHGLRVSLLRPEEPLSRFRPPDGSGPSGSGAEDFAGVVGVPRDDDEE